MQFNSIEFIFYFLPAFLLVYYLLPEKLRPAALSLGSFLFYGLAVNWDPLALGLLAGCVLLGYLWGLVLDRWPRRWLLWPVVLVYALALVTAKLHVGGAVLPVGMSFYVFQLIACLVDIRRGKIRAERSPLRFAAEMVMFPKLLSGPIADNGALQKSARRPGRRPVAFHLGLQEFILGLALKVVLANRLGGVWAQGLVFGLESVSTPFMWLALVTWCLRLYFDFYGYSLMAVGLGHMLGWNLPLNFREPYSARSVSDFYRRWHATLGRWFRDYVYIPLGGSRRGTARTLLNLALVWALTGFWHGVGGGYMLWAAILFLLIAVEKLGLGKLLQRSKIFSHIYLIPVILLSWVPFAAGGVGEAVTVYSRLFGVGGVGVMEDFLYWIPLAAPLLGAGILCATPLPGMLWRRVRRHPLADGALFVLFWVCLYFIATSAQDPFIYFQF